MNSTIGELPSLIIDMPIALIIANKTVQIMTLIPYSVLRIRPSNENGFVNILLGYVFDECILYTYIIIIFYFDTV
ncbi:hypothetical protein ACLUYJ_19470, partial [Acinetobacter baumannii]|uniref:hypothetical protein n=1 Tax=Acinetobacter baumannii TaxID=470 RepID=UPI003992CDCD